MKNNKVADFVTQNEDQRITTKVFKIYQTKNTLSKLATRNSDKRNLAEKRINTMEKSNTQTRHTLQTSSSNPAN
jgi:hypothetical protein